MSQDERLQEALTDFRELYDERLIKLIERYRRTFTITKKFPLAITCSIKTARNNRWSMTLYARNKTDTKSPGFIPLLKYRTSHGIGFLYPKIMDNWTMDVSVFDFTPHLISRYKERFLQANGEEEQVVENFMVDMMIRNMPLYIAYDEKHKCYVAFINDGIFLSNQCNPHRYIQWKTFVSKDMLFEEQVKGFERFSDFRKSYMEKVAQTGEYAKGLVHLGNDGFPLMYGKHKTTLDKIL